MKQIVKTENASQAIGPYSQGVLALDNRMLFISGQLPIHPQTLQMPLTIQEQTKQSIENIKAILEEAGFSLLDVCKTTVYLKNINDFSKMNEVYQQYFQNDAPARSAFEVGNLPKDAFIEIEVIACK